MDIKGKNVFISGPMTGVRNHNAAEFADVHARLAEMGAAYVYDPVQEWLSNPEERPHEWYMRKCIDNLTMGDIDGGNMFDLIVQLPGWKSSRGAQVEAMVAEACGIEAVPASDIMDECQRLPKDDDSIRSYCDRLTDAIVMMMLEEL